MIQEGIAEFHYEFVVVEHSMICAIILLERSFLHQRVDMLGLKMYIINHTLLLDLSILTPSSFPTIVLCNQPGDDQLL
jgi:hypothetical protein